MQDPTLFRERFDSLLGCLVEEEGWLLAKEELRQRKVSQQIDLCSAADSDSLLCLQVVCMNVYDIALDFILLDAFTDLENPPSTVVAVLHNRWITDGMKKSVLPVLFSYVFIITQLFVLRLYQLLCGHC